MKDIVKNAIIETKFYDTIVKPNYGIIKTFENLDLSKTENAFIRKNHNLNSTEEILLLFNLESFFEGDFFTASRNYKYSLIFLEDKFKFFRIVETSGWDKEEDYFDEIYYSQIEHVEFYKIFVRFFGYDSNEYFDLESKYFGLNSFDYTEPFVQLFNNIINKLKENYDNDFQEGEKYQTEFWKEYENGNYEKALEISNVFESNFLQAQWNNNNLSIKEQILDIPNFWINKAQVLTMLGDNDKALVIYDTILEFEENDENNYFINRAKIWKSKIFEDKGFFYEALQNLNEGLPNSKRRDDHIYNPQRSISLYNKFLEVFKNLPYKERKVIHITNSKEKLKTENLTILEINNLPEINFPAHHPINNETYIGHPYNHNLYIPIHNYDSELLIGQINEFCYLLQCLGAELITIENINSNNNSNNSNEQTDINFGLSGLKNGLEIDNKNAQKNSSENQINFRIGKNQTFNPVKFPYVPEDLTWLSNEAGWQRLIRQRLEGNLLEHNELIDSSQSQILNTNEINDLKVDLQLFIAKANVNVKKEIDLEIKNNVSSQWKVSVKFKPINQFQIEATEANYIEILDSNNDKEREFIDEYKFLIADGDLTEKDLKILERLRIRLGITEERSVELIKNLNTYTEQEKELVEEIKFMLEDGEISERDQKILLRLSNKLNISEDRCVELINKLL